MNWILLKKKATEMKKYFKFGIHFKTKNLIREHRKWVVGKMNALGNEFQFLDIILAKDNKNYHAWVYRLFLILFELV